MMFEFVPFHEVAKEVIKISPQHIEDSLEHNDYKIDIDWDYCVDASLVGQLVGAVMKEGGKIVGYSFYQISEDILSKGWSVASSVALYVEESHRGKDSIRLLNLADEKLKEMGVKEVTYTFADEALGKLIKRQGFTPKYTLWSKHYG